MTTPIRTFPTPDAVGDAMAELLLSRIEAARAAGKRFVLGSPTGRTPKPVYTALAKRATKRRADLSHVTLVMMDEYLVVKKGRLVYARMSAPWSCHYFARVEIAEKLNASLPAERQLSQEAIWFPDPDDPSEYERRIADAGGIDLFMLASGASDGHVAFNPPGSPRDSRTRLIPLSEPTRRDNLATFPEFGTLENVPRHGVSVGIATIADAREAVMLAWGMSKRQTVQRIRAASAYASDWPATLIHECRQATIMCDAAASGESV